MAWVLARTPGRRCWALEGTGCYGAGLARFLADHGEWVVEINPAKHSRQGKGKSDALDAERAGRQALASAHLATPRQRGQREALRVLHLTRASAVQVYADARRLLKARTGAAARRVARPAVATACPGVRQAGDPEERPDGAARHAARAALDR